MKPVTLGIVGARRGSSFARTALDGLDGRVRLTSVCDIDAGVLAQWRREHPELAYYQSYEQFLAQANVDAVVLSTPLQLHAPQALQALQAGKHVLSEVIAATTLDECWALIAAVQQSGLKYMFAENSCYRRENMLVLNMVEQGLFGETICAEGGYIHDCTHLMYFPIGDYGQDRAGEPTWRGRILQQYNGSWYPTHSLGPVAQWLGINRHDRLVTTTTYMSHGPVMPEYVRERFGAEHPDAHPEAFAAGCRAMTLIKCASGALITIIVDTTSPRPHNMVHYVPARHRRLLPVAALHRRRRRAVAARAVGRRVLPARSTSSPPSTTIPCGRSTRRAPPGPATAAGTTSCSRNSSSPSATTRHHRLMSWTA